MLYVASGGEITAMYISRDEQGLGRDAAADQAQVSRTRPHPFPPSSPLPGLPDLRAACQLRSPRVVTSVCPLCCDSDRGERRVPLLSPTR